MLTGRVEIDRRDISDRPECRRVLGRHLGVVAAGLDARQRFRIGCGSNNVREDNSHGQAVLRIQGQDVEQVLGN